MKPATAILYTPTDSDSITGSSSAITDSFTDNNFSVVISTTEDLDSATVTLPLNTITNDAYLVQITRDTSVGEVTCSCEATLGTLTQKYVNASKTSFIYKFKPQNASANLTIRTTKSGSDKIPPHKMIVHELFRYSPLSDANTAMDDKIWQKINQIAKSVSFDPTNSEFATIKNPLDATSFLHPDHVYNKFTICQWQESESTSDYSDITVISTIK